MNRKLVINVVVVVSALSLGIALSAGPWRVYRSQRDAAQKAEQIKNTAEKSREDLTRRRARYDSELGKEELARSHGYRQQNETPVQNTIQAND